MVNAQINTKKISQGKDLDVIFKWVNDKKVRENSFNKKKIPYSAHKKFWVKRIKRKNISYIFYIKKKPFGLFSCDSKGKKLFVNYLVSKDFRGRGLSKLLLKKGIKILQKKEARLNLFAKVLPKNIYSVLALNSAGFKIVNYKTNCITMKFQK